MNLPICAKCKKQVNQVKVQADRYGLHFYALCHGEQEEALVPMSFLKITKGPAKIKMKEAFKNENTKQSYNS